MDKIRRQNVFFTWDIHYKCNYNCTYCFLHFEPESASIEAIYLEPEKWIKIWTDIYKKYGSCHILVTGGEPFTYPNFINIISELSSMHTFEFSTNLSWDAVDFTKKIDYQKVKIDSSFHPEFIGIDEFLKKVSYLKERKYLINVTFVAYPPLIDKIVEYEELFKRNEIKLVIYPYRGPYLGKKYPEAYNEQERKILKQEIENIGNQVSNELLKIYDTNIERAGSRKKEICGMGKAYAKIVPNGDAFRCCAAVNKDWGYLGNIINNTFSLFNEARECPDRKYCRCYKAMVIGEEDKWEARWYPLAKVIRENLINKELDEAKALRDKGEFKEAIGKIYEILTKYSNNIRALILLGEIYLGQGNFLDCEKTLQDALKNNSNPDDNSWIYRVLGRLYCESAIIPNNKLAEAEKKQKFFQALEYLNAAIKFAENSNNSIDKAWSRYEIAFVYYHQKNYSSAKENIEIALKYEPENGYFKKLHNSILKDALRITVN